MLRIKGFASAMAMNSLTWKHGHETGDFYFFADRLYWESEINKNIKTKFYIFVYEWTKYNLAKPDYTESVG
jgi:hypothetical protein